MSNYKFNGLFGKEIENFIQYREALGYYKNIEHSEIYDLSQLNDYLNSFNLSKIALTKEMSMSYVDLASNHTVETQYKYECRIRQFAKFLRNNGYKDIYIQYESRFKRNRTYTPYVFSHEEIISIIKAVDEYDSVQKSYDKFFYQTIFRLLYCTGMRIGETLALKPEDVDLVSNVITIHHGKGSVSRIIPITSSLAEWLKMYKEQRLPYMTEYFFESLNGSQRCKRTINNNFKKTVKRAGILAGGGDRITVHSLIHTFACHALDKMIRGDRDPYNALPYLSIYLGHKNIQNTEYYLKLTEERFNDVIDAGHHIYESGENNND